MSVAAYEREVRRAQRLEDFQAALDLDRAYVAFANAHHQDFPPARRPSVEVVKVDHVALETEMKKDALRHVPFYKFRERQKAVETAHVQAEQRAAMLVAKHAADARAERMQVAEVWEKLRANDPETVMGVLEEAFEDNESPAAPLNCEIGCATILMRFPSVDGIVPATSADETPTGRPTVKRRTKTQRNSLYGGALCSHILATAKEGFSVAPGLNEIHLLVIIADESDSPTPVLTPIAYAEFERDVLEGVDWEDTPEAFGILDRIPFLANIKGRTGEVSPLDLREEPELSLVVQQIAADLGGIIDTRTPLASKPSRATSPVDDAAPADPPLLPQQRQITAEQADAPLTDDEERARLGFRRLTLKEARQGETLVLQTEGGPRVAVRIGTVLDPVEALHWYDAAGEHQHLVAVEFELTNQGPGVFSYDPALESNLLGSSGAEYSYYVVGRTSGPALEVPTFTDQVRLAPNASRSAYVCYTVDDGDRPQRVEVVFGLDLEADIGQWTIHSVRQGPTSTPDPPLTKEDRTARWIDQLRQPDAEKRKEAASALAAAPNDAGREALLNTATKDPEFTVRFTATEGLVNLGGPEVVSLLRTAVLQDPEPYIRQRAVRWLADIRGDEATDAISSALKDNDRSVRGEAERALDRRDGYADPTAGAVVSGEEAVAFAVDAPESSVPLSPEWSTTVTGEEDHQDVLRELAPPGTGPERWENATLGFCTIPKGKYAGQQAIEVRLGGKRVGQLTRAMSERYEKLVRDALDAGKAPICRACLLLTRDKGVQIQIMMPDRNQDPSTPNSP